MASRCGSVAHHSHTSRKTVTAWGESVGIVGDAKECRELGVVVGVDSTDKVALHKSAFGPSATHLGRGMNTQDGELKLCPSKSFSVPALGAN